MNPKELREKRASLIAAASELTKKASDEKRDMTPEENQQFDDIMGAQLEAVEKNIQRADKLEAETAKLDQPQGRRTQPTQPGAGAMTTGSAGAVTSATVTITGGEARMDDKSTDGFRDIGEFARSVFLADFRGGARSLDPRLETRAKLTGAANEGSGAEGGFLIPSGFSTTILQKVMGEEALLPKTNLTQGIAGNALATVMDNDVPYSTTGIRAYWLDELEQKTKSAPRLNLQTRKLNKIAALVPASDEILEDAPVIEDLIRRKAPLAITYEVNRAIIAGNGVGQPLGIVNAPGTIEVAKESGQAADTILLANVLKMWARMYAPSRKNAIWITTQDVDGILPLMRFDTTSDTPVPVYMPVNGIAGAPYGTLMGRPLFYTAAANAVGDKGDLILADLDHYRSATKGAGVKVDTSIHLYFDYDATAFRFVLRVTGQPDWEAAATPRVGATVSPFVVLAERA